MTNRPIFVCGYQRSGTTLIQSVLGAHPRIAAPPETYFIFRIVHAARRYGDLSNDAALRRALHDALHPPLALLEGCGFDEDRVFERARAGPRTMGGLLDAIMSDFAERHGKARWSEKSPGQAADEILRLMPDAQIVHIVRDPRDIIASSLDTPWTHHDAYTMARQWQAFTHRNARAGLKTGPGSFIQIRYEDLTRDPRAVLRQVFTFLDEPFDAAVVDEPARRIASVADVAAPWQRRVLDPIAPTTEGGWRKRLRRVDRAVVEAILHSEIATFGYAPTSKRAVAAGWALSAPRSVRYRMRLLRLRQLTKDPDKIDEMRRSFLEEQARSVHGHPAP